MPDTRVLIAGAGALGMVTGYHLSLRRVRQADQAQHAGTGTVDRLYCRIALYRKWECYDTKQGKKRK
jgi:cation diffusion facilitator CzcD-associated flavoprotein CzcO